MTKPDDRNEEYADEVWGILHKPVECLRCHKPTNAPAYEDNGTVGPFCRRCHAVRAGWLPDL